MEAFSIDFQRVASILRDKASGLLDIYPQYDLWGEIMDSQNRLQMLKNSTIFGEELHMMRFKEWNITGSFLDLVNTLISQITYVCVTE